MPNRRSILLAMGALAAFPAASRPVAFFRRHNAPIGIQLYTVKDEAEADLDDTLGRLSAMGYRAVEPAGLLGRTPSEWSRLLAKHGLSAPSAHVSVAGDPVNLGEGIGQVAATYGKIGVRTVVMFLPPVSGTLSQRPDEPFQDWAARLAASLDRRYWRDLAAQLNEKGARLRRDGLSLAYHNHNIELMPQAGSYGLEILLRHTDPALVHFEMDAGWVSAGGLDPIALLRAWPGRFHLMHVKDLTASSPLNYGCRMAGTEIGRGRLPWHRILPAAWSAGVRHFYVEQEPPFPRGRFEAAAANARYLAGLSA